METQGEEAAPLRYGFPRVYSTWMVHRKIRFKVAGNRWTQIFHGFMLYARAREFWSFLFHIFRGEESLRRNELSLRHRKIYLPLLNPSGLESLLLCRAQEVEFIFFFFIPRTWQSSQEARIYVVY